MTERTLVDRGGDLATLIARVVVGGVFMAHGWPKMTDLGSTAQGFEAMGIPFPELAAIVGAVIEVGGGLALAVGFALPAAGILLALMMANAYFFAHVGDPLVGGFEMVLVLGVTALALGFVGGRYSLDRLMPWGRPRRTREPVHAS